MLATSLKVWTGGCTVYSILFIILLRSLAWGLGLLPNRMDVMDYPPNSLILCLSETHSISY